MDSYSNYDSFLFVSFSDIYWHPVMLVCLWHLLFSTFSTNNIQISVKYLWNKTESALSESSVAFLSVRIKHLATLVSSVLINPLTRYSKRTWFLIRFDRCLTLPDQSLIQGDGRKQRQNARFSLLCSSSNRSESESSAEEGFLFFYKRKKIPAVLAGSNGRVNNFMCNEESIRTNLSSSKFWKYFVAIKAIMI